jgi:glycosyltransferase involved in cell wall biosynthesis
MNASFPGATPGASLQERDAVDRIRFSVIIPVLNEEKVIGRCLESLKQLNFAPEMFEVIVVDNGSVDGTIEMVHKFESSLNVKILEKKGVSISALRNLGAARARGEVLGFLDADCLAPTNWACDALTFIHPGDHQIIGARYRIPEGSSWVARAWSQGRETKQRELVSYVPSGNLIISHSSFLEVGGFDEQLQTNEDYEFCQRALSKGFRIVAHPDIAVIHLGTPQRLQDFYRKQRWHGTHVFRVFLRDPNRRQNAKAVLFTSYMFGGLLICCVGLIPLCLGHPVLFLTAISATLLAPILLTLKDIFQGKRLADFGSLVLLYATFGIARCASLLNRKSWQSTARTE